MEVINDKADCSSPGDWGTSVVQPSDFYDGEIDPQSTPKTWI
ncbi:MAG: hypothetical protein ACLSIR_08115 [Christensenellales bacterium]